MRIRVSVPAGANELLASVGVLLDNMGVDTGADEASAEGALLRALLAAGLGMEREDPTGGLCVGAALDAVVEP